MADKPTTAEIVKDKPDAPAEDDVSFTVERFTGPEAYEILGYDGHVVEGAFTGLARSKEVSLSDAKKRVAAFLKAEVPTVETPQE